MAEKLGFAKCPLCANVKAKLTLSTAGLACMSCSGCSCQIFARSGTSDEKLRALLIDKPAPAADPKPAPKAEPKVEPKSDPKPTKAGEKGWDPYA